MARELPMPSRKSHTTEPEGKRPQERRDAGRDAGGSEVHARILIREAPRPTWRSRLRHASPQQTPEGRTPRAESEAGEGPKKNSASRWRFRPPTPLTFGFRLAPSKSASTYFRSVLAAVVNLLGRYPRGKRSRGRKRCKLQTNVLHTFHTRPTGLWSPSRQGSKRARPGARSDDQENDRGDDEAVDDEHGVRVTPHVVEQDPDRRQAVDRSREHPDDERAGRSRRKAAVEHDVVHAP